jgi:hypothetical protein
MRLQTLPAPKATGIGLHRLCIGLSVLLACANLTLADSTLAKKSPFLPPDYGIKKVAPRPKPAASNGPLARELEFRGIIQLQGRYRFSLFNKKENKGYWVTENQMTNGILARDYDAASMSVDVTINNRTENLTLITANENPLPVAKAAPTNLPQAPNLKLPTAPPKPQANKARTVPRRRVILPKKG